MLDFLHRLDGAVTSLALDIGPNVRPVLKKNEIRHSRYFHPLDGLLFIPVFLELLDFRFVRRRNFMTAHAALKRRDTGHGGAAGIAMAVLTGNLVFSRVNFVAEGDGLVIALGTAGTP